MPLASRLSRYVGAVFLGLAIVVGVTPILTIMESQGWASRLSYAQVSASQVWR